MELVQPVSQTSPFNLLAKLRECSRSRDLKKVAQVHTEATDSGLLSNLYVANSLIDIYGECRSMSQARQVFDSMLSRDVVTWNALLQGYAKNGKSELALQVFDAMKGVCSPDARTYVSAASACGVLAAKQRKGARNRWLWRGKALHGEVVRSSSFNIYVENTLIDMYGKCSHVASAHGVFDCMEQPDVVTWNALLQGYVENGESEMALDLFHAMEGSSCSPNNRTYIAALSACASLAERGFKDGSFDERRRWFERGKSLHSQTVVKQCCTSFVEGVLVDMYSKCGEMELARGVFESMAKRDVVSWTALLQGYVENGESEKALELFGRKYDGCVANSRTYAVTLSACASLAARDRENATDESSWKRWLQRGKDIFSEAVTRSCCNMFVESSLIDLHAKSGDMNEARTVFDNMTNRDVVTWNALIMGYVDNGQDERALELVSRMNVSRNSLTYVGALMACTNLMAAETGKAFHTEIRSLGLEKDVVLANNLIDFYGKCGDMERAKQVFDRMSRKTIVSWTALMCGYSMQGETSAVFEVFEKMREAKVAPNEITFVCILTSCSHAGLTEKGKQLFEEMESEHGVVRTLRHYACMADLYSRANYLEEAVEVVTSMPFEPDAVIWKTILAGCHKWKNVHAAKLAYEALMKLNRGDASAYVLMTSVYRDAGLCAEAVASSQSVKPVHGTSNQTTWTDEQGNVHRFVQGH